MNESKGPPRPSFLRIAKQHGIVPSKRYGQHFLVNEGVLERIVTEAHVSAETTVLEIGPGIGNLTWHLAMSGGMVVAVEKDRRLEPVLRDVLGQFPNVTLIYGDARTIDLERELADRKLPHPSIMVANLPYNVAATLLLHYLARYPWLERYIVMVQKEVADRIVAKPGHASYSGLSVKFQALADARRLFDVSRGSFWPPPDVTSSVIELVRNPRTNRLDELFSLVDAAFAQRRKTIANSLAHSGFGEISRADIPRVLEDAGIQPGIRPERLGVDAFFRVLEAMDRMRQLQTHEKSKLSGRRARE
jgi:16S rRNA (adenine1518-N6/adenine1519-N6)-dimethyltransferase